jgi:hypothetical protein
MVLTFLPLPAGKGKLKEDFLREIFELTPATAAQRRYHRYLLVSAISHQWRKSPLAISVENRFIMDLW